MRFHSHLFGLGGAISVFEGAQNDRLIFTCTPVDDECSDRCIVPGGHESPATPPTCRTASWGILIENQFLLQRLRRSANLALPEVRRTSTTFQGRRERVDGTAEVGDEFDDVHHKYRAKDDLPGRLAAPGDTAIVTQERQARSSARTPGGVLAKEGCRVALPTSCKMLPAARAAGVRVRAPAGRRRATGPRLTHCQELRHRTR